MRSLKSWLPVVVVFLVSLAPVIAVAQTLNDLIAEPSYPHSVEIIRNGVRGPFRVSLAVDDIYVLATAITMAGIAVGAGIFFGLKARGAAGKAS